MIGYLASGTDAAGMTLLDPAAGRAALAGRAEVGEEEVMALADAGDLLYWYTAADGAASMRVYVDEPVPADLRARAEHGVAGLLLRAPGGRLVLTGIEELQDLPDDPAAWPGAASGLDLPPGDYVAEAFEVGWSAADDAAFEAALRAEAGAWPARLAAALAVGLGLLLMVTVALAIPGLVMLVARPARFLQAALGVGPWLLAAWLLMIGAWRLPVVARVQAARARLEADRPDAVVALRRLGDGEPRPARGGAFGEGYGGSPAT